MRLRVIVPVTVLVIAVLAYSFLRVSGDDDSVQKADSQTGLSSEARSTVPVDHDRPSIREQFEGASDDGTSAELIGRSGRDLDPVIGAVPAQQQPQSASGSNNMETGAVAGVTGAGSTFIAPDSGESGMEIILPEPGSAGMDYVAPEPGSTGMDYIAPEPGNTGIESIAPDPGGSGLDYIPPEPGNTGMDYIAPEAGEPGMDLSTPESETETR